MGFRIALSLYFTACLFLLTTLSTAAFAENSHERTQFGHDIIVGPNEEVQEVNCLGCNVRIRGHVAGDVTVFGGSVVVEDHGQVGGDTTVFGGGLRLGNGATIRGDTTVFGGTVHRDADSSIGGDVTNFAGPVWILLIFVLPFIFLGIVIALVVLLIRRLLRPSVPATA
jgi:hypothetical protein